MQLSYHKEKKNVQVLKVKTDNFNLIGQSFAGELDHVFGNMTKIIISELPRIEAPSGFQIIQQRNPGSQNRETGLRRKAYEN